MSWNLKGTLEKYLPSKNFDQYLKQARQAYDQGMKDLSAMVNHQEIKKIKGRVEKEIKQLELSIDKAINKDMSLLKKYWDEKRKELGELQHSLKNFGEKKLTKVKQNTQAKVKSVRGKVSRKKTATSSTTGSTASKKTRRK